VYFATNGQWILTVFVGIFAVQYWSALPLRMFMFVLAQSFTKGYRLHLTLDEKGIHAQQVGKTSGTRYWWRGLQAVREDSEGIEVEFDTPGGIYVPHGAIEDVEKSEQFRRRVLAHLSTIDPVAASR
jgi:hypothetical protein